MYTQNYYLKKNVIVYAKQLISVKNDLPNLKHQAMSCISLNTLQQEIFLKYLSRSFQSPESFKKLPKIISFLLSVC